MILSVDPGAAKTGVAVFAGTSPAVATFVDLTPVDADALIEWCQAAAVERREELVLVIEDQFATIRTVRGRGGKLRQTIDVPSLLKLARSAEVWAVLARLRGHRVVRVLASTWQAKMLATVHRSDKKARATKRSATQVFAETWPEVYQFKGVPDPERLKLAKAARLNEHVRDAALMGRWFALFGMKEPGSWYAVE